ncbi:hypothetical protein [Actinomadura madurae]|uniref:hypothetical protein n=1 Tax=Actinomadura madurae TaxID=1993 RepID=UPI0020D20B9B|nr:hypothetical protein [Actinomadura madurae]MCQ0011334.1 hypothetical protein [Actinomadura madurae]
MPVSIPVTAGQAAPPRPGAGLGPRVSEFTLPAVSLPHTATAGEVLDVLTAETGATCVVLVDDRQRPLHTVHRTRFLLQLSGAYGHALHARRRPRGSPTRRGRCRAPCRRSPRCAPRGRTTSASTTTWSWWTRWGAASASSASPT